MCYTVSSPNSNSYGALYYFLKKNRLQILYIIAGFRHSSLV